MRTGKIVKTWMIILLLALLAAPTAVFAGFDGKGNDAIGPDPAQHEDEGEESSTEDDHEDDGHEEESGTEAGDGAEAAAQESAAGFVLGFLGGIIFLIIAVVAVIGAVGLGIIGIGYASTNSSEE